MNGEQIRAAREARGWTQYQLAKMLGVADRTVGSWERGESIPKNRLGMLRELFGFDEADNGTVDPIHSAPESELLMELLRRATLRERRAGNT